MRTVLISILNWPSAPSSGSIWYKKQENQKIQGFVFMLANQWRRNEHTLSTDRLRIGPGMIWRVWKCEGQSAALNVIKSMTSNAWHIRLKVLIFCTPLSSCLLLQKYSLSFTYFVKLNLSGSQCTKIWTIPLREQYTRVHLTNKTGRELQKT